jgi:hypothetical protein
MSKIFEKNREGYRIRNQLKSRIRARKKSVRIHNTASGSVSVLLLLQIRILTIYQRFRKMSEKVYIFKYLTIYCLFEDIFF